MLKRGGKRKQSFLPVSSRRGVLKVLLSPSPFTSPLTSLFLQLFTAGAWF